MTKLQISIGTIFILLIAAVSCSKSDTTIVTPVVVDPYAAIKATFGTKIDPTNLVNYANQARPAT